MSRGRRGRVHWAPVEAIPAPNAPAVAGAEDADKDADEEASEATFLSGTTVFGDSTYTDDEEANGGAGPGAAVAAEGPDAPRERAHRREGRPPRDTAPKPDAAVAGDKWSARNDADHVGNIGWLFGNWGKRPRTVAMQNHLDMVLKRNPAMIIGLAECDLASETLLRAPGEEGHPSAPPQSLQARDAYEYLTLRGSEESSVLIGIRKQMGSALDLLL